MKDRIIQFLAQGHAAVKVAEMVGCSEAYISEVRSERGVEEDIEALKKTLKRTQEQDEQEDTYIKLEAKVSKMLIENMPFAEFSEATRLMEVLIRRKQHTIVHNGGVTINQQFNKVINLTVPHSVIPEIVLNKDGEILSVGEQSLTPMSSQGVRSMFDTIKQKKLLAAKQVEDALEFSKSIEKGVVLDYIPEDF